MPCSETKRHTGQNAPSIHGRMHFREGEGTRGRPLQAIRFDETVEPRDNCDEGVLDGGRPPLGRVGAQRGKDSAPPPPQAAMHMPVGMDGVHPASGFFQQSCAVCFRGAVGRG
jgi:hypothetical protein